MNPSRRLVIAIACLIPGGLGAQQPSTDRSDPAKVARAFLDAVELEHWSEAAAFLDPVPIERLRQQSLRMARFMTSRPSTSADELRKANPSMPAEIATYYAQMAERFRREDEQLLPDWANVKDTATLASLSPLEAAARFLEAQDENYVMRRSRERDPNCAATEVVSGAPRRRDLFGVVARGDTAFALQRTITERQADPRSEQIVLVRAVNRDDTPTIIALVRSNGVWHIVPRPGLVGRIGGYVKCQASPLERVPADSARGVRKPPS